MIPTSKRDLHRFTPSRFDREGAGRAIDAAEAALGAADDAGRAKAERTLASARRRLDQVEANIAGRPGQMAPVYLIEPPGVFEKARAAGLIAKRGAAVYPGDRDLIKAIRRVVEDAVDTGIDAAGVLAFLDRWDGALAAGEVIGEQDEAQIGDLMLYFQSHPLVSARLQARATWRAVVPIVMAQMFLAGAEHAGFDIARGRDGLIDEQVLARIPDADCDEIGWQAWILGSLSEADRGKSASLSSPPASLTHSTANTTTAADGTS